MSPMATVTRVEPVLYASLALTGRGHATDTAVMLGLMGFVPATLDPDAGDVATLGCSFGHHLVHNSPGLGMLTDFAQGVRDGETGRVNILAVKPVADGSGSFVENVALIGQQNWTQNLLPFLLFMVRSSGD